MLIISLLSSTYLYASDPIVDLFKVEARHAGKGDFVKDAVFFSLNKEELKKLHKANLQQLSLTIPFENEKEITLNLEQTPIVGPDFKAVIQKNNTHHTLAYSLGLFYRGTIYGIKDAFVAINLFEDEVTGVLTVNNHNYNIGRYEKGGDNSFVLYKEENLNLPNPFQCSTEDPEFITMEQTSSSRSNNNKKVSVYIECDYHLYKNMGKSSAKVMNFTTGLFNIVSTLYQQESITLEISEIKIWSTPDSYVTTSARTARNDFAKKLNGNFNGDVAALLSNYKVNGTPPNGGSANIDVLCNKAKAVSYTNITTSYLSFPTYSWTAYAVTHEIGHNLGSPHTHSCLWPTGPIDNCWCPEGNCALGPEPASSGTIMSYCHLNPKWTNSCTLSSSNPGINFSEGFGSQPGNLIRSKVAAASCLSTATPVSIPPPTVRVEGNDESCKDANNGSMRAIAQSGQAPYTYRWNTGSTADRLSNLSPGTYSITITDQRGNTATATNTVKAGTTIQINAGADKVLTCNTTEIRLDASSSTSGSQYRMTWSKREDNINSSIIGSINEPILRVTKPGTYIYSITNLSTGCSASDQVIVTRESSNETVQITGGQLTCDQSSVQLSVNTTNTTGTYQWIGPNGFTSSQTRPTINQPGLYELYIDNGAGCSSTGFIIIESVVSTPQIYAIGGTLNCSTTNLTIQGSSNEQVSYQWTGPNGFSSNQASPIVTDAGIYTLVIKNNNGCSNTAAAEVLQSTDLPEVEVEGGTITCTKTATQLQAQSSTANIMYSWSGPNNFTSNQQNPIVGEAGVYTLMATAENGCAIEKSVIVQATKEPPSLIIQATSLDCDKTSTSLDVITDDVINAYRWNGPNNFNSIEKSPLVNQAGSYTLTVWGMNGCSATFNYELAAPSSLPDFTLSAPPLSCNSPSTLISVSFINSDYSYQWTGPNNFSSTTMQPEVRLIGPYTLVITSENGCTASKSIFLDGDLAVPFIEPTATDMTCSSNTAQLLANSGNGVNRLTWRGPGGFISTKANPVVSIVGTYELTAIGTNGCSVSKSVTVKNESLGIKNIIVTDEQCGNNDGSIRIEMEDPTANYTIQWNSGHRDLYLPYVPAGNYSAVIKDETGCVNTVRVTVKPAAELRLLVTQIKQISCYNSNDGAITISLTGGSPPYDLLWSNGVVGATNNQLEPGTHSLEVQDAKGCYRVFYFNMKNPEPIDVTTELKGEGAELFVSGGSPQYNYQWSNGETQSSATDLENGKYTVTISDANNCSVEESFEIKSNENTGQNTGQITDTEENTTPLISPNPADTYFQLYHDFGKNQLVFISIFNSQGYYLYRKSRSTDILNETINTTNWENGTYYVQLLTVEGFMTEELKIVHN